MLIEPLSGPEPPAASSIDKVDPGLPAVAPVPSTASVGTLVCPVATEAAVDMVVGTMETADCACVRRTSADSAHRRDVRFMLRNITAKWTLGTCGVVDGARRIGLCIQSNITTSRGHSLTFTFTFQRLMGRPLARAAITACPV